jgi:pentapeptide repeat protein
VTGLNRRDGNVAGWRLGGRYASPAFCPSVMFYDPVSRARLSGARFERMSLRGATFHSVDLSGAQIRSAAFNGTRMRGVELIDLDF